MAASVPKPALPLHGAVPSASGAAEAARLEARLRREVAGEVRFDPMYRALYATDASMYRITPVGVVTPRTEQDVVATLAACRDTGTPLLGRGGGTSLAGQTVGRAVVVDFSKHLDRLVDVDNSRRAALIEPGIVLDRLNARLAPTGLWFAPDVAPSSRATVGGMILNNSCGAHSVLYGKTGDHVRGLKVLLADGTVAWVGEPWPGPPRGAPLSPDGDGKVARLASAVKALAARHAGEIDRRFPKILRRVGGYNLDAFPADRPADLTPLIVGSEGTLAVVLAAHIGLVPRPKVRGLMAVEFASLAESLHCTLAVLPTGPAAVEVVDRYILDLSAAQPDMRPKRARVLSDPDRSPESQLLVEYFCDSEAEADRRLAELDAVLAAGRWGTHRRILRAKAEQDDVWSIRKAGVGILQSMVGDRKPQTFVEDCAVAPERLPEFTRRFLELVRAHGTDSAAYAHASVGLLHFRPVLGLKTRKDLDTLRSIAEQTVTLALEFGGAMSGEHGDGLVRSCWNRRMFGDELYEAFREVKALLDPGGILNPGKITDSQDLLENLRLGAEYAPRDFPAVMDWSREGGFAGHVEMCNGNGACRKEGGQMCPSYQAGRDEAHSTRGRANALRAIVSGELPEAEFAGDAIKEVFDLCIECKGCRLECPSTVDVGRLKSEVLNHRHRVHGTPLRSWLFANAPLVGRIGTALAPLSNWLAKSGPVKRLNAWLLGLAPQRELPPFATGTFTRWWDRRGGSRVAGAPDSERRDGPNGSDDGGTILFVDCWSQYHHPEIARAAVEVLEAAGRRVRVVGDRCCGRPMISKGLLDDAKARADALLETLSADRRRGERVVVLEPSCLSVFRDESPLFHPGDPDAAARARDLAAAAELLEEHLLRVLPAERLAGLFGGDSGPAGGDRRRYLLHGHCHQKAMAGTGATLQALRAVPGAEAAMIDSGCCGMAGSFGYEAEHYEFSMRIAGMRLLPAVRAAPADTVLVAPGMSCRHQIAHATGRMPLHPAEALAAALRRNRCGGVTDALSGGRP